MEETELLKSFDAQVWSKEFVRIYNSNPNLSITEEWMTSWFANALMRGYDEYRWTHDYDKQWTDGYLQGCREVEEKQKIIVAEKALTKIFIQTDTTNRGNRIYSLNQCGSDGYDSQFDGEYPAAYSKKSTGLMTKMMKEPKQSCDTGLLASLETTCG